MEAFLIFFTSFFLETRGEFNLGTAMCYTGECRTAEGNLQLFWRQGFGNDLISWRAPEKVQVILTKALKSTGKKKLKEIFHGLFLLKLTFFKITATK